MVSSITFYDFCSFSSMAVNTIDELQFLSFNLIWTSWFWVVILQMSVQSAASFQLIFERRGELAVVVLLCFAGACQSLKNFFAQPFKAKLNSYRYDSATLSHHQCKRYASLVRETKCYNNWNFYQNLTGKTIVELTTADSL